MCHMNVRSKIAWKFLWNKHENSDPYDIETFILAFNQYYLPNEHDRESVVGSVIQATGTVEFEDGL